MKAVLPTSCDELYTVPRDHPWVLAIDDKDRVMTLYNEAVQDDAASFIFEEAKTDE